MNSIVSRTAAATAWLLFGTIPLNAQVFTPPALGPAPQLTLPALDSTRLPNGLRIIVSRNAEVPIVEARLVLDAGARAPGVSPGLAAFATSTLMEGAGGRSGTDLASAIDLLGARIGASASWENLVVSLRTPARNIDRAMALMGDVALRPDFRSGDIARLRALRLAALLQARDQPTVVASRVFMRNVFPAGHPYHADIGGDSASIASFDSASVRQFWTRAIDPARATLIVTGAVTLAEARAWATKTFGAWKRPAHPITKPAATTIAAPPAPATRIILVDKPGAAQSVIYVGGPGVDRNSPDYPAVALMNTILGGSFSSRLNDILREQRGYTYGAHSSFGWSLVPGPFMAESQVRTNVTDSSLAVFMREIKRIGTQPVTPAELTRGKHYFVLGSLGQYETAGEVANALVNAVSLHRPLRTIPAEFAAVDAVSADQLEEAAAKYADPAHLTIVVVGDLTTIRDAIARLNIGPIEVQTY